MTARKPHREAVIPRRWCLGITKRGGREMRRELSGRVRAHRVVVLRIATKGRDRRPPSSRPSHRDGRKRPETLPNARKPHQEAVIPRHWSLGTTTSRWGSIAGRERAGREMRRERERVRASDQKSSSTCPPSSRHLVQHLHGRLIMQQCDGQKVPSRGSDPKTLVS